MTTFVGALTAKKFLVSVYDPVSFLNGFIDPSSTTFNNFDQNVPNFFDLGRTGSGVEWPGGGKGKVSSGAGFVDAGTSTNVVGGGGTFNIGAATMGKISMTGGGGGTFVVNSSAVTTTSKIFLTMIGNNATAYLSSQAAGTFTITLGNGGQCNFLILN
jgi:hypothetical protein